MSIINIKNEYVKEFTKDDFWHIKKLYIAFQKVEVLGSELSWAHYRMYT